MTEQPHIPMTQRITYYACKACGATQTGTDCDEMICDECDACDWSPRMAPAAAPEPRTPPTP